MEKLQTLEAFGKAVVSRSWVRYSQLWVQGAGFRVGLKNRFGDQPGHEILKNDAGAITKPKDII